MQQQYYFVIYGVGGLVSDFSKYVFSDLEEMDNVELRADPFQSENKLFNYLYKAHTYPYLNKYFELPFKRLWNKGCGIKNLNIDLPACYIFNPKYYGQKEYFSYLRKNSPGCKLVMLFRDRVDFYLNDFARMQIGDIYKNFDLVYSYNKKDCEKYGFHYFNIEASKQNIKPREKKEWTDVVFIGRAKDRIEKIIEAYNLFSEAGLKTDFYVVGANKKYHFKDDGIVFSDSGISYLEMLDRTINSRCIFEVSQFGEYGFTSRSQEAIMYNKKLITDSLIVKEQRYYPSPFIFFYEKVSEIDPFFPLGDESIDYGYDGEYSPKRVLQQIQEDLCNL